MWKANIFPEIHILCISPRILSFMKNGPVGLSWRSVIRVRREIRRRSNPVPISLYFISQSKVHLVRWMTEWIRQLTQTMQSFTPPEPGTIHVCSIMFQCFCMIILKERRRCDFECDFKQDFVAQGQARNMKNWKDADLSFEILLFLGTSTCVLC